MMAWKMGRQEGFGRSWAEKAVEGSLAKLRGASTKTKQSSAALATRPARFCTCTLAMDHKCLFTMRDGHTIDTRSTRSPTRQQTKAVEIGHF